MTDTDLLPDRLKYFWADDEEGPYQGPFSSRELATSDAYTYRAKCFDDPSQDDGFFMMATHGLLVDAEDGPWRVLAIDVTDQFHDAWNTRASTPSSTRVNERGEVVPGAMRCAKCNFRLQRNNMYMQSGTIGPGDNNTEPCPNGCGPLWPVTWKEDALEGDKRLMELFEENQKLKAALQHTPQPSPQSDMVAVPREVMGRVRELLLHADAGFDTPYPSIQEALSMLQPYTKG
jgi:hypothetical protein